MLDPSSFGVCSVYKNDNHEFQSHVNIRDLFASPEHVVFRSTIDVNEKITVSGSEGLTVSALSSFSLALKYTFATAIVGQVLCSPCIPVLMGTSYDFMVGGRRCIK